MTQKVHSDALHALADVRRRPANGLLMRVAGIDPSTTGLLATIDGSLMASAHRLALDIVEAAQVARHFPGMASLGAWPQDTRVCRLRVGHYVLGRAGDCDLVLDCAGISRRHAVIEVLSDKGFVIRDLDSTNGTAVNGVRAAAAAMSEPAVVRLGPLELLLVPDLVPDLREATALTPT